jgi:hypothetical protein
VRKDNTNNYQTPYSRIQQFKDFVNKEKWEKDELSDIERSYFDNEHHQDELPNKFKSKYNKVTHKYDVNTRDEIKGRKKQIEEDFPEVKKPLKVVDDAINPNHYFSNNTDVVEPVKLKTLESFQTFASHDPQIPALNKTLDKIVDFIAGDDYEGCGCCDDCTGDSECDCCDDCECDDVEDYEEHGETTNYMFFGNIETIHRYASSILECDLDEIDQLLDEGHNWAESHVSSAKETLSHVYNFLTNKSDYEKVDENHKNYMFFANLENIVRFCEDILDMDEQEIDELLTNGHNWAEDHVSAALENIQQVYDWIYSEAN